MQAALSSLPRPALAHSLATLVFSCSIAYGAGFALGTAVHRLSALLSAHAVARLKPAAASAADLQRQATIAAWEEQDALGRWIEPWSEEIAWGSWWDLDDRSKEEPLEAEPPLRWAV